MMAPCNTNGPMQPPGSLFAHSLTEYTEPSERSVMEASVANDLDRLAEEHAARAEALLEPGRG